MLELWATIFRKLLNVDDDKTLGQKDLSSHKMAVQGKTTIH